MNDSQRMAKEWCEGVFPVGFEVLDIGAGVSPALGATRAVDIRRDLFTKDGKRLKKMVDIPDSLVEYINFDAKSLPYEDGFFDRIISRWAIGARIKGIAVAREAYRVLKRGGEIYISILDEDKETMPPTRRNLRQIGFEILCVYKGEYSEWNGRKDIMAKESVIHARK